MKNPQNIDELYIFDYDFNFLCNIKEFKKLEWTEKIFEADSFTLELEFKKERNTRATEYNYYKTLYDAIVGSNRYYDNEQKKYKSGFYYPRFIITNADSGLTPIAYIQSYKFTDEGTLEIKGEGFLQFLEKRYTIKKEYIPTDENNDKCGRVMCRIINDNNNNSQTNFMPFFVANEYDNDNGEEIYVSCERKDTLYKKLKTLSEAYEVGMRTLYHPEEKKIYFKTIKYPKKDLQDLRVLSEDDDNVVSIAMEVDIDKYRNYVLVEGEENVIIDIRQDKEKEPALELVIQSNKKRGSKTLEQYKKILEAEGREKLSKYLMEEAFDIEPTQDVKVDLGEYVLCKLDLGYETIYKQLLVSEITHTIENSKYTREVAFGKPFGLINELQNKILEE